jgi:hypothetical protein
MEADHPQSSYQILPLSAVRIGHCEKRKIVKAQSDFLTRLLHQLEYWQLEYWLTSIRPWRGGRGDPVCCA